MARGTKRQAVDQGPVEGLWDLPDGWEWRKLESVAPINPSRKFDGIADRALISFLGMSSVSEHTGHLDLTVKRPIDEVRSGYTRFKSGDVIFAKITPCMENGKLAIIPDLPHGIGAGSTEFHVLEPQSLDARFLFYWLSQETFRNRAEHNMTGTAGQKRVPTEWLRKSPIPVPESISRQKSVVARIDSLFAEIDAGEAELAEARAGVETYRKSLLKAAVTGELTADWRRDNPPQESGEALLTRILSDRRSRWHADPKNARKKYKEPAGPDLDGLPELPDGWTWATVQQLSILVTSGSRGWSEFYSDNGSLFLRAANLNKDRLDLSEVAFVNLPRDVEGSRTKVAKGDFLITITGANVTKCGVVEIELDDAYVSQHVGLIRPVIEQIGQFLFFWSRAYGGGKNYLEAAAYGAGKPGLNLPNIYEMNVAVPPLDEMKEIFLRYQKAVGWVENETKNSDEGLIDTLRQSILAAAFRGELTT